MHQIRLEKFNKEQDSYFIKHMLIPYLSQVYFGLIRRQNKDYLTVQRTKQYLGLPELIGERLCKEINANGDERIDHDEFVNFMAKMLMGSFEQKMHVAFRIYDVDDDQNISEDEVKIVLRNIPLHFEGRYGESFSLTENQNLTRVQYMNQR